MKNYDDLQRFKEKTQTLDIAFKDMSGQTQEAAEQSKWALIRQLAGDDQHMPFAGGQRIDLPQPQPLRGDEFSAPAPSFVRQNSLTVQPGTAARASSILGSLGAASIAATPVDAAASSLFPPPPAKPVAVEPASAAQPALQPVPAFVAPAAPVEVQPVAPAAQPARFFAAPPASAPATSPEPGRFGALFRTRQSEPVNLSKETLLKPLLEKIALCR